MEYWVNGNIPQANGTINKHSWQWRWNNFHMQTHFGITSTGTNDAREQHLDVAGTHYMDSSEQYIAQNVEWWTGWSAQWKFTEVSGWNSQQQYMGLMSTVETLRNGNASMWNEDIYNGDECNYSRQVNEKGGTWQLELLLWHCILWSYEWLWAEATGGSTISSQKRSLRRNSISQWVMGHDL